MRGGLKEMARQDAERAPPAWLSQLLVTRFFEPCPEHPAVSAIRSTRSVGCNYFCTHCASGALCSGCLAGHEGHNKIIQIRKSSSHGLVRVADIERVLNVSLVQTYLVNGEDAVFLDKREISGKGRAGTIRCEECSRGLQDPFSRFCSLGCKAEGIEDGLDFSVSFCVNHRSESSGYESAESESDDDDDDSPPPTKIQKQGASSRSSRSVAARGERSV